MIILNFIGMPYNQYFHLNSLTFCLVQFVYLFGPFRNIKGFMIQGGDPTGTGKGGDSIYGTKLPDEFSQELK